MQDPRNLSKEDEIKAAQESEGKNPNAITPQDKNFAQAALSTYTKLCEVKKQLAEQDHTKFPFQSEKAKKRALRVCRANVIVELETAALLCEVINAAEIIEHEKPFGDDQYRDFHAFTPWLAHVSRLHSEHMEQIHQLLYQIVAGHSGREKMIENVFQKHLICEKHGKPATGRSLDGKTLTCSDCSKE